MPAPEAAAPLEVGGMKGLWGGGGGGICSGQPKVLVDGDMKHRNMSRAFR